MTVIPLKFQLPDAAPSHVKKFSYSYKRMNAEMRFMKQVIEGENIANEEKLSIILDFVKVSTVMLDIWAKYALALSNSKAGSKNTVPAEIQSNPDTVPLPRSASNEGTEHGN